MPVGRGKVWRAGVLAAAVLAFALEAGQGRAQQVDTSTLHGAHVMGYQGWFGCPGDGAAGRGWRHWFRRDSSGGLRATVDMLPDVSELEREEVCQTGMVDGQGAPVSLYSALNPRTVQRHFRWMRENGISGVALQRFVGGLTDPDQRAARDRVLTNVRAGAESEGRSFFIMYDISGARSNIPEIILQDLEYLVGSGVMRSPQYQRHRGRPVVGIWGFGFRSRAATPEAAAAIITRIRELADVVLLGGVPAGWRTLEGDSDAAPGWATIYRSFDVLSPWTVGAYRDEAGIERHAESRLKRDLAETRRLGMDYMPVIFPGASRANQNAALGRDTPLNAIPRHCGQFYWRQVYVATAAGATMLYGAMFDEVDEGTAMFKVVPDSRRLPADGRFVALDSDGCALPADWYLRLAGEATRILQKLRKPSVELPSLGP